MLHHVILYGVVAYLAGLWLGPFLPYFPLSFLGALLSFACFLTWLEQRGSLSKWGGLVFFALIVGGMGQAYVVANSQPENSFLSMIGTEHPVKFQGRIVAPVRHTPTGLILLIEVRHIIDKGRSQLVHGWIRLTWREPEGSLVYGNHVRVTARIREPFGTLNPGGFHYGKYLKQHGVHAVATVSGPEAVQLLISENSSLGQSLLGEIDRWRLAIYQAATSSLQNPALGLFLGMIIGEQSYIEQDIRDAFMATGTVHILSISGSHLGILALVVFAVVTWCVRRLPARWLERASLYVTATECSVLATLPVVTFYMLLAGAEMATVRSWIMIVMCCLGVWFGRERNLFTALAAAALLMLATNPGAIHDISFQLSFLSVVAIGLVLIARKKRDCEAAGSPISTTHETLSLRGRLLENSKLAWWVTLAVSLTTLPLVAYYFHQIPWLGLFTNMIIVPVVGLIVIPIGLLAAVGVLFSGANTVPLESVIQWIFDVFARVIVGLSQVPGAEWHVASPTIITMLVFWLVLAGLVWVRQPPVLRWGCFTFLSAILVWWAWSPRTNWEPGLLRVTFLDVGQGDATFLELPDGQTVLIDGGPAYRRLDMGRAVIGPYLWNRGIHRIDHVVATHPQWDHVGGLPWVLKNFEVGAYWDNGVIRSKAFYKRLQTAVQNAELEEHSIDAGSDIVASDSCSLSALSPSVKESPFMLASAYDMSGTELNNRSLVIRLECNRHSFLFTADAEQEALEYLRKTSRGYSANVVKVPHHGAKSSLHDGWLNQIQAQAMVISVGSHNRYGHPASEVVEAYEKRGLSVYRTDRDGAIIIDGSLKASGLTITTAQQQQLVPVILNESFWENELANWKRMWN